jgi:hypothetical protein
MSPLEDNGHALLIRDLLKLHRGFSFRRYRIDILGFLTAWLVVALFIAFYWWMSSWGKA